MIGVVVITHGGIGRELIEAAENMTGPQEGVAAVSVAPGVPLDDMRRDLAQHVAAVEQGSDGVLILSDIFGGTPCNMAAGIAAQGDVVVVTGVNLPMLVAVLNARKRSSLSHVAQSAIEAGRHYIGFAAPPKNGSGKAAEWTRN